MYLYYLFVSLAVCMFVCVYWQNISQSYERTLVKFSRGVGHVPRANSLDFGGNPNYFVVPRSFSMTF